MCIQYTYKWSCLPSDHTGHVQLARFKFYNINNFQVLVMIVSQKYLPIGRYTWHYTAPRSSLNCAEERSTNSTTNFEWSRTDFMRVSGLIEQESESALVSMYKYICLSVSRACLYVCEIVHRVPPECACVFLHLLFNKSYMHSSGKKIQQFQT